MAYFYKYDFISPEPIYAIIKEELKSYFDTGAVDDLLFPVYTNKCLEKLGRSSHPIVPVLLFVEDFTARLPDNFYAVREAWYCTWVGYSSYRDGRAFYTQSNNCETIQVTPITTSEAQSNCEEDEDCEPTCTTIQGVYKTLLTLPGNSYRKQFLLKPGNISIDSDCNYRYNDDSTLYSNVASPVSANWDSFDIHDNKFVTTFREGVVEMLMYASDFDNLGNQMIPDNFRIREYIEAFIKYKIFETLTNQTNDETFNQLQQKMMLYKQMADEAYIMAESEIKKQDAYTKQRRIRKSKKRFDKYELSSSTRKYRLRAGSRNGRNRYDY